MYGSTSAVPGSVVVAPSRPGRAGRPVALLAAGLAATALLALLVLDGSRWVEIRVTDSLLLVEGSHTVVRCLSRGVFDHCDGAGTGLSPVGAWPIAQYLVAVPLVWLGLGDFSVLTALAVVSAAAAGGMLLLAAFPIRRLLGAEWSVVLAVALLTSPFLLYAFLPFGESLAAFLALAFVIAACARRPGWLLVTGLLAGTTKETIAPFLFVLAVVCARDARDRWLPERRVLAPITIGLGASVVLNGLFNVFRFGTVRNVVYTAPKTRVPGVTIPVRLALADWFAPNVGVVWFWAVVGMFTAGLVVSTGWLVVRHRRMPAAWLPAAAVVAVVAVFTAGLSLWYSTFGWVAWGPRLTLPLLPAVMVTGVRAAREPMTGGLHWLVATVPRALVVGVVIAGLGIAQVGVVWHRAAIELPLVVDEACPQIVPVDRASADYFYGCGLHEAWRLHPLSLWEGARHGPVTQTVAEVVEVMGVAGAVIWLHRRNRKGAARPEGAKPTQA